MKAITGRLTATFSDADRQLVAAANESDEHESQILNQIPVPMDYHARLSRAQMDTILRQRERRLRGVAVGFERWGVELGLEVSVVPVADLYRRRQLEAPSEVEREALEHSLGLYRLNGRIGFQGGLPVYSLRLVLEFDPDIEDVNSRSQVRSLFPAAEGRKYHGTSVFYGLRPDLSFWVPLTSGGSAFTRIEDMGGPVREAMLVGPVEADFHTAGIVGGGNGTARAEWMFSSSSKESRRIDLETMLVLRAPKSRSALSARVTLEAGVLMPGILRELTGKTRHIRDSQVWDLPLPR